jgi:mannitol/fructose-specific phosphotransferase system IIA component (Ntr-type)
MAELVDLLNDRKFYKLLDQAKDPQAICEYIAARADTRKEKQL